MHKALKSFCKKNSYSKIYEALKTRTIKQGMIQGDAKVSSNDVNELMTYLEGRIKYLLYSNLKIPTEIIAISEYFGPEFMKSFQSIVTSYVVPQNTAELSGFLSTNFKTLFDLGDTFNLVEKKVENINFKYANVPSNWGMDLLFLTRAIVMIKQKICDHFFVNDCDEKSYSAGLSSTLDFELKIRKFLKGNKCCHSKIHFHSETDKINSKTEEGYLTDMKERSDIVSIQDDDILCIHMKMLSNIFIPCLNLYYKNYFQPYLSMRYNQRIYEMNIIEIFTIFFRELKFIYEKINYFDDISVIKEFCAYLDSYLTKLISKIFPEKEILPACIVLNTIVFISQTMDDISTSISERYSISIVLKASEILGKIEKTQNLLIDRFVATNQVKFSKEYGNSTKFIDFFERHIPDNREYPEEVTSTLLEIVMSNLLAQISLMKLNKRICEDLISDICEIENFLRSKYSKIPYMKMIKNYLKIFACSTESREEFVNNFLELSNNTFTFHQILNALENQKDAGALFIMYKKIQKL